MLLSVQKIEIALARREMSFSDLRKVVSPRIVGYLKRGKELSTKSAGRVAKALGVDVIELVNEEGA